MSKVRDWDKYNMRRISPILHNIYCSKISVISANGKLYFYDKYILI